jgi:hypothetical protein
VSPAVPTTAWPELSVVLITADRYEPLRKTVRAWSRQAGRDRVELIVVGPSRERLAVFESDFSGFAAWRVVEIGAYRS